jgi:hypothetical protein
LPVNRALYVNLNQGWMMNRIKVFRILSFVIGLGMLLASTMVFLGLSFFPETNNIGVTGSSLVGAYFMFYAVTGTMDVFKYFKTSQVK